MKKMYVFLFILTCQLLTATPETNYTWYYFPECQVRIPSPEGWYACNETQSNVGMVFVSKEEIIGITGKFITGLSLYTNYERALKQKFSDTQSLAEVVFQKALKQFPSRDGQTVFNVKGKLGEFKFLEITEKGETTVAYGVIMSHKGAIKVTIEGPRHKWKSLKPVFLYMVKNISFMASADESYKTVYSKMDHPASKLYAQRDSRQKERLLEKFNSLKVGMSLKDYINIMEYRIKWVKAEGKQNIRENKKQNKKPQNETPGWLESIILKATTKEFDFIDIFGVYDGCFLEELFYVHIENKTIIDLNRMTRYMPTDFDVQYWERFLAGFITDERQAQDFIFNLTNWRTEKKRAMDAFDTIKTIKPGSSELEYLSLAKSFRIHLCHFQLLVIPGLLKINGPTRTPDGLKKEYLYAYNDAGAFMSLGKVVMLNGKVHEVKLGQ